MDYAIDFMEKQGSWSLETEYPYTAKDGACSSKTGSVSLAVKTHKETSGTQTLADIIENDGAPSVAVDASSWSTYTGGVLSNCG